MIIQLKTDSSWVNIILTDIPNSKMLVSIDIFTVEAAFLSLRMSNTINNYWE